MDAPTNASIRNAVAAGLRKSLSADASPVPDRLEYLLAEMRRRETEAGR